MKIDKLHKAIAATTLALLLAGPMLAQTSSTHQHTDAASNATPDNLAEQLAELQKIVQRLEHQLQSGSDTASMSGMKMSGQTNPKSTGKGMSGEMNAAPASNMKMSNQSQGGMKMGMRDKGMGMMKMNPGGMDSMSDMNSDGSGMMGKGMNMMGMMKKRGGMSGMGMQSALPGFPGASHIYHIGATDFFLDHSDHIQLTIEQQAALARIKEKSALEQATAERNIEEVEQQLWELTGADEPNVKSIESKIEAIEKLRGDQRLAFIRAVGNAAKLLTDAQVKLLTGMGQESPSPAHSNH